MNKLHKTSLILKVSRSCTALHIFLSLLLLIFTITSCEKKYTGPQYEIDLYEMLDDYSTKYCRQNNMELLHIGDFSYPKERLMFGLWLRSYSNETLDEGRARALTFVNNWVSMMQNNKIALTYFEESKRYYTKISTKLDRSLVGLKIAYWDKNVNRPKAPYLAEIAFVKDTFRYYEADPKTQALKLVLEESYDDAMKHLVAG